MVDINGREKNQTQGEIIDLLETTDRNFSSYHEKLHREHRKGTLRV